MRFVIITTFLLFSLLSFAQVEDQDKTLKRIESLTSEKDKASAYNVATRSAWKNGNFDDALEYSKRGLKIAKENNFKSLESKLYNNRGIAYDYLSQYSSALENYFAGLSIQEKLDDPLTKADIYGNIGLIYMNQELNQKSLHYHKKSLKLRQSANNLRGISASLNNIAIIYTREGNPEMAIENYLACIEIDTEANDTIGLGDNYNNIALAYLKLKEYDVALEYLEKALEIRKSVNDIIGQSITYSNFGEINYLLKNYDEARKYFLLSIALAKQVNERESLRHSYFWLSENEIKANNPDSALKYYKLHITYQDSIMNAENVRQQAEFELNYEFDKEKEVTRLRQEDKDRQYSIILIAVSSGLILILLFSILFFRKWKQTQAQQEIIEEKNELVQHKNDEILASISYAKRIQKAILPSSSALKESFPKNFVLYLPKDIVSGDFYWMDEAESTLFLAVADCTGHGVPGAMMSVVCHNALNRSVHEFGKRSSSEILNKTRELVINEMSQQDDSVSDGMDISLCVFDKQSKRMNWAGANNPIWIYRNSSQTLEEIKADKQPIGNHQHLVPFHEHQIELATGDRIYLFSDGYQDQFGGVKLKKMMRKGFKKAILLSIDRSLDEQQNFLLETFNAWKNEEEQVDDVCVICVEF